MTRRKRRNHSAEFKVKVALAAIKGDHTLAELSTQFDLHQNQIIDWKNQLLEQSVNIFSRPTAQQEPEIDIKALHAKIGHQALQIDFLEGALRKIGQLSGKKRKVTQQEAAAYFDAVFNNTSLSIAEQDDSIIQFYRNVANEANATNKTEPNGRAMSKVMDMFNGQGRGAELSSAKGIAYGLLCSITEFVDHERRAMSTDHRLDSAWFGTGAAMKQRGLEQALRMVV